MERRAPRDICGVATTEVVCQEALDSIVRRVRTVSVDRVYSACDPRVRFRGAMYVVNRRGVDVHGVPDFISAVAR